MRRVALGITAGTLILGLFYSLNAAIMDAWLAILGQRHESQIGFYLWSVATVAFGAGATYLIRWLRGDPAGPPELAPEDRATCDACGRSFWYRLIHSGFNDSAYAYCDGCGMTSILNAYGAVPSTVPIHWHQAIAAEVEPYLRPCACGGRFRRDAAPRCPGCKAALSADRMASAIETNAPGTAKGWRWQRTWTGLYCLLVEGRTVRDNWLESGAASE